MASTRTLKLSILADIDNLTKGLSDGNKATENFAEKAIDLGKKIAGAFAVKQIIDFGTELAKAAMQEEESVARLDQTLKDFTGATNAQIEANKGFIDTLSVQTAIADDNLRPAMARLARSLGDVEQAQKATELAAKISVNTGKDVETVANAMAKAADGQTTALARLGLGFSAAELKGKDFAQITDMLNQKFPDLGANADTAAFKFKQFQQFIENTKESLGAALLPILEKFFDFVIKNLNPALDKIGEAFKPIIDAIKRNKEAFEDLARIAKDVILPVIIFVFEKVVKTVADAVAAIIDLFGKIERFIKPIVDRIVGFINNIIEAYNRLPFKDIPTIGGYGSTGGVFTGGTSGSTSGTSGSGMLGGSYGGTGGTSGGTGSTSTSDAQSLMNNLQSDVDTLNYLLDLYSGNIPSAYDPRYAQGVSPATMYNITVNGAIDAEGTAKTIVDVLSDSYSRGGVGVTLSSGTSW